MKDFLISKAFLITFVANFIWINASEVFRYFVFIMPMMRDAFPQIHNIAPMDLTIFAIWGLWDLILIAFATFFHWLFLERFGASIKNTFLSGIVLWSGTFLILWLGIYNMNLANPKILLIALPLSLIELIFAAFIVRWKVKK